MDQSYRILIAEDDALISETLKEYLEEFGHTVTGIVSDSQSAIQYLEEQPDFVFLDIRMHGKDEGFEIARLINEKYQIPFLFLTSFSDKKTVLKASGYNPLGYLVKPFKKENIFAALEIAIAKSESETDNKIEIKDGTKTYYFNPQRILFLKSDNNYVDIYCEDRKVTLRSSLDEISIKLPPYFIKCHRSFIVNKNKIEEKKANSLKIGQHSIKLSRTYKEAFK